MHKGHLRREKSASLWELACPILQIPRDHLLRAALMDFLLDPRLSSLQIFVMARDEGRAYVERDEATRIAHAARSLATLRRRTGLASLDHFFAGS